MFQWSASRLKIETTAMQVEETRLERRLRCWESCVERGKIEAQCPVCRGSTIRYNNTSGTTFQQMHIVPQRDGGSDQSWNLLPGCGCNQNMRYMNLLDWMGTRGNKASLLKAVFLSKYKSLVPPCHRRPDDRRQLVAWVRETYAPERLDEYSDWLLLLDRDLALLHEECEQERVENPLRLSPYFSRPRLYNAHRRYAHCYFRKKK
jgi:hypothetical protein